MPSSFHIPVRSKDSFSPVRLLRYMRRSDSQGFAFQKYISDNPALVVDVLEVHQFEVAGVPEGVVQHPKGADFGDGDLIDVGEVVHAHRTAVTALVVSGLDAKLVEHGRREEVEDWEAGPEEDGDGGGDLQRPQRPVPGQAVVGVVQPHGVRSDLGRLDVGGLGLVEAGGQLGEEVLVSSRAAPTCF